ncbi:acyltransferase family protein [Arthrobacter sp. NPDC057013]|uniref:acyltransferase family protein n=1 Tax=Arthrobacter sp. NPDC057013 TaxID=3345999 RepID=UPI0036318B09
MEPIRGQISNDGHTGESKPLGDTLHGKPLIPPRSGAVDFLRVLGITAVVAGHVTAWAGPLTRETLYPWHVPLFFFLSGYFWSKNRTLKSEVRNRAKSLLVPYLFWLVVIGVWWVSQLDTIGLSTFSRLLQGGSKLTGPFAAFWFVTALFVTVVLLRAIHRFPLWLQWAISLGALAVTYADSNLVAKIPLAAGVGCTCLVFVLAGQAFKRVRSRLKRPLLTGSLLILGSICAILADWSSYFDLKNAKLGVPIVTVVVAVAICAGMVLLAETLVPMAGQRFAAGVTMLARCGFLVVLTHAWLLIVLMQLGAAPWLVFAGSLVIPWLAGVLVLRTPLSPLMLGTPKAVKPRLVRPDPLSIQP